MKTTSMRSSRFSALYIVLLALVVPAAAEEGSGWFLLHDSKHVVKTDAGEMKVILRGGGGGVDFKSIRIGFITMEPQSLFTPQYLDSSLILFIRRGEATVGSIDLDSDSLVERRLKKGDIFRIAAGSAFYVVNTAEGQRLHIICSITTAESFTYGYAHPFQAFYVGGGTYPRSVLAGFDHTTLSTAFNVSEADLGELLRGQNQGPIVYISSHSPSVSMWSKFLDMDGSHKLRYMRRVIQDEDEQQPGWSFGKLFASIFGSGSVNVNTRWGGTGSSPDAYNLYDRKPDFKNNYGSSIALDYSDYAPLKHDDIGVYLVNLTAGSMMAPHINPRASEYGIVLKGSGTIQIVYPNGTLAMSARVSEGDVFWVPRFFPFCQIASRTGPFEFFGFTTCAGNNKPQFLAGANSLLHTMRTHEVAAAFGYIPEDRMKEIVDAQKESTILPSATVAPPDNKLE